MFPEARTATLVVKTRPLVIPLPDTGADKRLWSALLDLADIARTAINRDQSDRATEAIQQATREIRQSLGSRNPVSEIIDLQEAAAICRLSVRTLHNRMCEDPTCPRLPGKHPTFNRAALVKWRANLPLRKKKKKKKV